MIDLRLGHCRPVFLLVLCLLALARGLLLFRVPGALHGDEAVVGVMALGILDRGELPLYFPGVSYAGGSAFTAYVGALVFAAGGGPSELALKLVPFGINLVAVWLVYRLVRSGYDEWSSIVAAALYGTAVALLRWSLDARGCYAEVQCLVPLAFWLLHARCLDRARAWAAHGLLGIVCGVGIYMQPTFIACAATVWGFLLARAEGRRLLSLASCVLGFAVGASPVWMVGTAVSGLAASLPRGAPGFGPLAEAAKVTLIHDLPASMAYDNLFGMPDMRLFPNLVEYACYVAGLACLLVRRDGGEDATVPTSRRLLRILLAYVVVYVLVYAAHPLTGRNARYLLPLLPVLSALAAVGITAAARRGGWPRRLVAALALLVVGTRVSEYARLYVDPMIQGPTGRSDPRTAVALTEFMERRGIRKVRTGDWDVRWRIAFLSRERIRVEHLSAAWLRGIISRRTLNREGPLALVLEPDEHAEVIKRLLDRRGLAAERHAIGGRDVYLLGSSAP